MMDESQFAKIRWLSGKRHAVNAAGSATDGSLYGFETLCGMAIGLYGRFMDGWREDGRETETECGNCRRIAAALERK